MSEPGRPFSFRIVRSEAEGRVRSAPWRRVSVRLRDGPEVKAPYCFGLRKFMMVPSHKRVCVIVAGMHRSGTSALTRVLNLLGCTLPQHLLSANPTNEAGHWEPIKILEFNDRLLASAGTNWDEWTPVAEDWFESLEANAHKEEAAELFLAEYPSGSLTVLKDPRLCRLLPFWLDVLKNLEIDPVIAIPVRHPLEVVRSLAKRDLSDPYHNRLLWLRHVVDAERYTRGLRRYFCSYDDLLENWSSVTSRMGETLGVKWPKMSAQTLEEAEAFLRPQLRHHQVSPRLLLSDKSESDWLKTVYAIVSRWATEGESSDDIEQLDRISSAMDEAGASFGVLALRGKADSLRVRNMEAELGEARRAKDEIAAHFDSLSHASNESRIQNAGLAEQIANIRSIADAAAAESTSLASALQEAESKAESAVLEAEALKAALSSANERADRFEAVVLEMRSEAALQADKFVKASEASAAMLGRIEDALQSKETAFETLLTENAAGRDMLDAAYEELEAAKNSANDLRIELSEMGSKLRIAEAEITERSSTIQSLQLELQFGKEQLDRMKFEKEREDQLVSTLTSNVRRLTNDVKDRDALRVKLTAASQELADLAERLVLREAELEHSNSALRQKSAEAEDAYGELERAKALLTNEKDSREHLERVVEGLEANVNLLLSDVNQRKIDLEKARSDADQFRSIVESNQRRLNAILIDSQITLEGLVRGIALEPVPLLQGRKAALRKKTKILKNAGVVDTDWYKSAYPDVVKSGIDPVEHYIKIGYVEGRKPKK